MLKCSAIIPERESSIYLWDENESEWLFEERRCDREIFMFMDVCCFLLMHLDNISQYDFNCENRKDEIFGCHRKNSIAVIDPILSYHTR